MDQVVAHIVRREQELSHPAQVVVPREVENRPPAALSAWFLYVFKQQADSSEITRHDEGQKVIRRHPGWSQGDSKANADIKESLPSIFACAGEQFPTGGQVLPRKIL